LEPPFFSKVTHKESVGAGIVIENETGLLLEGDTESSCFTAWYAIEIGQSDGRKGKSYIPTPSLSIRGDRTVDKIKSKILVSGGNTAILMSLPPADDIPGTGNDWTFWLFVLVLFTESYQFF
jgi:hypothetical protein